MKWLRIDKGDGSQSEETEERVQRMAGEWTRDVQLAMREGFETPFAIYRRLTNKNHEGEKE